MAQMQAVQEATAVESMTCVKALVKLSLFQICHLRGLLPEAAFDAPRSIAGVDNLRPLKRDYDEESSTIIKWLEQGVNDALDKKCLSKVLFTISAASDSPMPEVLEQFEFSFTFTDAGTSMQAQTANGGHATPMEAATPASLKKQACALLRMLITSISTLSAVPDDRTISMHLIYNNDVDAAYEPPGFTAASAESLGCFVREPTRLPFGSIRSQHHKMHCSVRSVLDVTDDMPYSAGQRSMACLAEDGACTQLDAQRSDARAPPPIMPKDGSQADSDITRGMVESGEVNQPQPRRLAAPPAEEIFSAKPTPPAAAVAAAAVAAAVAAGGAAAAAQTFTARRSARTARAPAAADAAAREMRKLSVEGEAAAKRAGAAAAAEETQGGSSKRARISGSAKIVQRKPPPFDIFSGAEFIWHKVLSDDFAKLEARLEQRSAAKV